MSRALPLVLLFALTAAAPQGPVDREKLELIRRMSPEERAVLKTRLEEVKKLPREEREHLRDNLARIKTMPVEEVRKLREKAVKLTPSDFKELSDLASGFFRWAHRTQRIEGFPRGLFFAWLKKEKPGQIEEIYGMGAEVGSPRVDAFVKLYHEFREVALGRLDKHVSAHRCFPPDEISILRERSSEFWPRFQELQHLCQAKRPTGAKEIRQEAPRRK